MKDQKSSPTKAPPPILTKEQAAEFREQKNLVLTVMQRARGIKLNDTVRHKGDKEETS
jgi:hypothetical protein